MKRFNRLAKGLMVAVVLAGAAHAEVSQQEYNDRLKLVQKAYQVGKASEVMVKDYLYIGNNVALRQAVKELKKWQKLFDKNMKIMEKSINDSENKNLLIFIQMSAEDLNEIIKEPFSLDNAEEAMDLSQTIMESAKQIAQRIKKSIGFKSKFALDGSAISFQSIPKYYMAYQAGIKDENTVKLMEESVKTGEDFLERLSKNPKNTVAMNKIISKNKRLWSVVKKFYLKIEEGGLPFVVYKTSQNIGKNLLKYNNIMLNEKNKK